MNKSVVKKYRPCVGVALFNREGRVFVGERIDTPGAWQMPQGGIDENEDLKKAAYRELQEEIGVRPEDAELLEILDTPLYYDAPEDLWPKLWRIWGAEYHGQVQNWIAMRFKGKDSDINLDAHEPAEFSRWQWVALDQTLDLIVPFKRDVYLKLIDAFKEHSLTN